MAPATSLMVLQELDEKLRTKEESRRVMVDDPVGLQLVVKMLESPLESMRWCHQINWWLIFLRNSLSSGANVATIHSPHREDEIVANTHQTVLDRKSVV